MGKEQDLETGSDASGPVQDGLAGVRRKRGNSFSSDFNEEAPGMCDRGLKGCLLDNLMLIFLVIGIVVGILTGVLIRQNHPEWSEKTLWAERQRMYLGFCGKLFLRMLKCMIIPLIMASLISGMAQLPTKAAGRIGGFAVLYYGITTLIAVIIGIILVSTIKPGSYAEKGKQKERVQEPADFILDLVRNVFPDNIIAATQVQTLTTYDTEKVLMNETDENGTLVLVNKTSIIDFEVSTKPGTNVLGIVVFSIVLGLLLGKLEERGRPMAEVITSLNYGIIEMVRLIIWFAPVGICFLLAEKIVSMEDPAREFKALAVYMGTVTAGLAIHAFIILPIIYLIATRKNPFTFAVNMLQALLTALGTASSSATLPLTLRCMELKAGVDRRIGQFILPVGATINMDGTALYEAVASIFIAQVNGIELNVGQTITVAITATAAAVGAAGVPEAGLVTMSIVLVAVGLPVDDVALIAAVDWLLDRFRTTVNVWGDSVGCGVVEALCRKTLAQMDHEEEEQKRREELEMGEHGNTRVSGYGHHNPTYSGQGHDNPTFDAQTDF